MSEIQKNPSNNLKQADPSGRGVDPVSLEVLRRRQKFSKQGLAIRFLTRMEERIMFQAKDFILDYICDKDYLILIILPTRIILIIFLMRFVLIIFLTRMILDYICDANDISRQLGSCTSRIHLDRAPQPTIGRSRFKIINLTLFHIISTMARSQ